jgi:monofunctional biosynthetic peptidoglycan transglycosylase
MGEWRELDGMASHIIRAVLAGEDQRFFTHHGFDFIEMNRAVKDLLSDGKVRGASTISMQTARTVFLWPSRSLGRKITEAYFTLLIEALWSKERIMEVYLNTVDWGPHVMGIEAASRNYYKRSSASLTRSQSALLAAVLPNPHKWSPVKPNAYVLQRKAKIQKDMMKISLPWKTQGFRSIR